MQPYIHHVQYYETDKMGITHHSNYIRWMEEARVDFLEQIGWSYAKLESLGIVSPVIGIECLYKKSTTFNDKIQIELKVTEYRGLKFTLDYVMKNRNSNQIVATGKSRHCFLDAEGKPLLLNKKFPELHDVFNYYLQQNAKPI
ncbi:acyl-CoA thioester hydrolase [Sporanaerobium hydrogeniformans]|uniref:Acyl-CoA thioester hydrolase n=2 Tax=Sporanaerobium hydrogeniformans TaxID=3072179 RepID=A0AC61D9M5_9FIRM|nr:acyl-CoA thioester hydrolase [Sporanaerobium hydrogeniformans]